MPSGEAHTAVARNPELLFCADECLVVRKSIFSMHLHGMQAIVCAQLRGRVCIIQKLRGILIFCAVLTSVLFARKSVFSVH